MKRVTPPIAVLNRAKPHLLESLPECRVFRSPDQSFKLLLERTLVPVEYVRIDEAPLLL